MENPRVCFNAVKAILVRLFMIVHNLLTVWRVTVSLQNELFWYLLLGNIFIVLDGIYSIVRRRSLDSNRISTCFLLFLLCTLPPLWLLELSLNDDFLAIFRRNSTYTLTSEAIENGIESVLQTEIDHDTWVILVEETLVYVVIVGRWFLPRGDVTRDQLSELLFIFIGMASDIMEVFGLFAIDAVRLNTPLTYSILAVWSISLFQFTFIFKIKKDDIKRCKSPDSENLSPDVFRTQMVSVVLGCVMQDIPFLTVRMYTLLKYRLITNSMLFFVLKNILLILMSGYRIVVLCCERPDAESREDPDNDSEPALIVMPTFIAMSFIGKLKRRVPLNSKSTGRVSPSGSASDP